MTIATLSGCSDDGDDQTTPSGLDADYSDVELDQAIEVDPQTQAALAAGTQTYLAGVSDALRKPGRASSAVPGVTGPAADALAGLMAEYAESGWHVIGTPRVVNSVVVKHTEDPETIAVGACLDSSNVKVVDKAGKTVPNTTPAKPRTLNVFVLVPQDGAWVVARQTFPNDPDC